MTFGKKKPRKKRFKVCPECKKNPGVCSACKGTCQSRIKNGRNKGNTFERAIAKQITDWVGVPFSRVPLSGGWNQTGDITPKKPEDMVKWKFGVECKNQEAWTIPMLFKFKDFRTMPKKVKGWWKQCADDAKKSKRTPLLIFTKANEPVFLLMRTPMFRRLQLSKTATAYMTCGKFRVMLWEEFLTVPYPQIVKRLKGKI